ncbi:hypothetical protein A7U60_g6495 [Sanghuangporus baumii]|uniref:Uncharacterized protein n=1 Tax=Sanghuangporus baumii TaxID=108892 RepID=A0A9Q5HV53_SANBA|nr:hypothetical protein A7U60_g6495 [Sanghuangporus baumii]
MHPGNFNSWHGGPGYFNRPPAVFMYGARCRLFPRLFWFALGAGAFAFWSSRERNDRFIAAGGHNGEWRHWSNHRYGCHRRRDQLPQDHQQQQFNAAPFPAQATQQPNISPAVVPITAAAPPVTQPVQPQTPVNTPDGYSTEWSTARVREATEQASDTVAEMSENALDTLMANLRSLKAKIAEAREAREKERLRFEQHLPQDKPNQRDASPPGRLV